MRSKLAKFLSITLILSMLLSTFGFTSYAAEGNDPTSRLYDGELWSEPAARSAFSGKFAQGEVKDGALELSSREGIEFKWTSIPGIGAYDSEKTYTLEFDLNISSLGDGTLYSVTNWHKELHFGFGGYYTLLDICGPASNGNFAHGFRTQPGGWNQVLPTLNSMYHVKSEWKGADITTTIYNSDNEAVVSGTRKFYYSTERTNKYLDYFSWLCDDGTIHIDNFSFSNGTTTYTQNFDSDLTPKKSPAFSYDGQLWSSENITQTHYGQGKVVNGALVLNSLQSVQFNWNNIPGISEYSSSKTYTMKFDVTVSSWGTNTPDSKTNWPRELFVGPGGYNNMVEIRGDESANQGIRVYGAGSNVWSPASLNTKYAVEIVWKGTDVTSTVYNPDGSVILTGTRTGYDYSDSAVKKRFDSWAIRCEDGTTHIDNFSFSDGSVTYIQDFDTQLRSSETAVTDNSGIIEYSVEVEKSSGDFTYIEMDGDKSSDYVFEASDNGIKIAGYDVIGDFADGKYTVTVTAIPAAYMLNVEVVCPDGKVVRRGDSDFLFGNTTIDTFKAISSSESGYSNASVKYDEFTVSGLKANETEPVYEGFDAKVYNLVTSYDGDAKTTRAFSWAALTSYVSSDETMAVKYRVKGQNGFNLVDATRKNEVTEYDVADFFEADITGLTPGTTYEYQIGKKDSSSTDDWSKLYTFTTEKENENEFTFVTVADTQGDGWDGRGFMYAEAAIDAAFADVGGTPDLMLHLGDVVETGGDYDMWKLYFKALGEHGTTVPHFAAVGNHEYYGHPSGENVGFNFNMHFNHPNNGGRNAIPLWANLGNAIQNIMNNPKEAAYSFDYANAHFIVLATGSDGNTDQYLTSSQKTFLTNDLVANADAKWKIMILHHPEYGWSTSRDRLWLAEIIESNGVDLVLQGHVHGNARSYPIKNGEIVRTDNPDAISKGEGTVYSILGSTTTNHKHVDGTISPNMVMAQTPRDDMPVYAYATVSNTKLTYTIKQLDGYVVDEFTIYDEDAIYQPEVVGTQIRIAQDEVKQGLRFISSINKDLYTKLETEGILPDSEDDTGLGFGSVIIPEAYIPAGEKLTKETSRAKTVPAINTFKTVGDNIWYTVCLTDILLDNYTANYAVVPYVTYMNGDKEVTVYGEMLTASVYDVALLACKPESPETDATREYLQENVIEKVEIWLDSIYRP